MRVFLLNAHAVLWALLDGLYLHVMPQPARQKQVLIIRLDAIGDFVLWLDAARELFRDYQSQGYSVVLLGNRAWANWAKELSVADEVWDLDVVRFKKQLKYRWQCFNRIRKAGFEVAIQPTYSRFFLEGDSAIRASSANERIGSAGDESNAARRFKAWGDRWYTHLIPAVSTQMMELKRNAEFMRGLDFADFKARCPHISRSVHQPKPFLPSQPYAVLVPTASWNGKMWPINRFIQIGKLMMGSGLHLVLVGGPTDRESAKELIDLFSDQIVDLVGKTSLGELAEVLRNATVVVTNDTSAVHIGAAVDAPVVCILGGGHFGRFAPYDVEEQDERRLPVFISETMPCFGCNWHCRCPRLVGEAVKCVSDISVEKVWAAVEQLLIEVGNREPRCLALRLDDNTKVDQGTNANKCNNFI